jgi:hypothetical protein
MAKGDVVQQDKSFMGMPVSHFPLLPASWPVSAAIEPAIGKQPSQCHQSCLPSGARMLRDGLAVTGDALARLPAQPDALASIDAACANYDDRAFWSTS